MIPVTFTSPLPRLHEVLENDEVPVQLDDMLVFLDETGLEDFSDPKNHAFGLGGVYAVAEDYDRRISRPWLNMKKLHFGGEDFPFHANELCPPVPEQQISALNRFLRRRFNRLLVLCKRDTVLPEGWDANGAMIVMLHGYLRQIVKKCDVGRVHLRIESSDRRNEMFHRDWHSITSPFVNRQGKVIPFVAGYCSKEISEPGLEVADLLLHVAQAQYHHELGGRPGHRRDYQAAFMQHGLDGCSILKWLHKMTPTDTPDPRLPVWK